MQTQRTRKVHKNMSTYRDGPTGTVRPLEECPRCGQEVQTSLWSARSAGYQSRCDELGFPSPTLSISTLCTQTRAHAIIATEYARQHIWVGQSCGPRNDEQNASNTEILQLFDLPPVSVDSVLREVCKFGGKISTRYTVTTLVF